MSKIYSYGKQTIEQDDIDATNEIISSIIKIYTDKINNWKEKPYEY